MKLFLALFASVLLVSGCQTPRSEQISDAQIVEEALTISEGDSLRVTFAGAPDLNTTQKVRRDGRITLPSLGEIKVAQLTPAGMEEEILKQFGNQLVTKQVTVTMEPGSYPLFVSGAVLNPGRINVDRPITALQAIMEAGGFDRAKANTKAVRIIRHEGEKVKSFTINLKRALDGNDERPFYVKASDIIYVPERFSWF